MGDYTSCFSWNQITVSKTVNGKEIELLKGINGSVENGKLLALMGPSGCGKTTLLNILAARGEPRGFTTKGQILCDGKLIKKTQIRQLSSYVEQEDALVGSLNVFETIDFAGRLSGIPESCRTQRVEELIQQFGLENQKFVKIGTPVSKGISGGQKRRVSLASQLITGPRIFFLDEPTSGLDSKASFEILTRLRHVAKQDNMIVIASIHQPSTSSFELFDSVTFLSQGQTVYTGPMENLKSYFSNINHSIPSYYNPADFILDLVNSDFNPDSSINVVETLTEAWNQQDFKHDTSLRVEALEMFDSNIVDKDYRKGLTKEVRQSIILLQRLFIKARRDILTYYVRVAMYIALAVLMGTVWLRLNDSQQNIQPFINAIFFSGAFMSFMSVAYIPSFLEDFHAYNKERLNGLYGPTAFTLSNFLIGVPFLFIIAALFSIITYFMVNFRLSATGFFMYLMWLFLDLVAAESMVVFITSLAPIFVVSLALTAFMNGLWMSVGGFLVPASILNKFWYYTFYWINYQRYVFQGMMFNELGNSIYNCGPDCHCMYSSPLESQCEIDGNSVLQFLGYGSSDTGLWVGIMICIIFAFRFLSWLWLSYGRK